MPGRCEFDEFPLAVECGRDGTDSAQPQHDSDQSHACDSPLDVGFATPANTSPENVHRAATRQGIDAFPLSIQNLFTRSS